MRLGILCKRLEPTVWDRIENRRSNRRTLQRYLDVYPNGKHRDTARQRLDNLRSDEEEEPTQDNNTQEDNERDRPILDSLKEKAGDRLQQIGDRRDDRKENISDLVEDVKEGEAPIRTALKEKREEGRPKPGDRLEAGKEKISDLLNRKEDLDPALFPEMVFVEGGSFTMGCLEGRDKDCDESEKPAHEVRVKDFYIGKYEVTNEQFAAFLNAKGNQEEGGDNGTTQQP